ncbi:hypothetical protein MPH47_17255 [Psychrobacillus psychrodurans]|uniref:hypothetical protein n=1 Tax=Psychrobacillus psychrodurans TaxID=126157 RepID=UPI001F4E253B|nr:hypothetical protein [Psychrobacillus psychrodurans]MCK1998946.1 hypothetical protein [Psychrobacillus psychrodurans]
MNNKLLIKAKKTIATEKDGLLINSFLFGFMSILILSKEKFKKNDDIKSFLEQLGFHYKEYVFLSRTIIISRVIRDIEKLDENQLEDFNRKLLKILNELYPDNSDNMKKESKESTIKNKENYVSKIIDKYNPQR